MLRRDSETAADAGAPLWPAAGEPILPLAGVRGALAALAQLPADAAGESAAQPLAAAAAALAHLVVLVHRLLGIRGAASGEQILRASRMAATVCEQTGFLQHLPGLLSLPGRGFVVVEGALLAAVDLTYLLPPQPEGRVATALRLLGAALQAMVRLLALEARFAGFSKRQAIAAAPAGAPEAAAASADGIAATAAAAAGEPSLPAGSYSLTLLGIADSAIRCLHNSHMSGDRMQAIAQCGPGLQEPELLRRIACRSERPPPGDSAHERLCLLWSMTSPKNDGDFIASPILVALRRGAGDEVVEFCLAGIRQKLAREPAAAGGASAETRAQRAAIEAVSSASTVCGHMMTWFGLLSMIVGREGGEPGDEVIRMRLLHRAVDGGAASLVLTALEAAALVPGPAGADYETVHNSLCLLDNLNKYDVRCWREAIFEDAPLGSALRARRPAWAAAAAGSGASGRARPPWTISIAVDLMKKSAARQPTLDSAWFLAAEDAGHAAIPILTGLALSESRFASSYFALVVHSLQIPSCALNLPPGASPSASAKLPWLQCDADKDAMRQRVALASSMLAGSLPSATYSCSPRKCSLTLPTAGRAAAG